MANVNAILAIIGAVLAALTAILLTGAAVAVPAAFALAAGVYVLVQGSNNKMVLAGGVIALLAGVLSFLGAMNGVSLGGFTFDFSALSGGIASALAILGCLEITAMTLKAQWNSLPPAGAYIVAAGLVVAVLLGFIMHGELTNQSGWVAYVVGAGALTGLYPAILATK